LVWCLLVFADLGKHVQGEPQLIVSDVVRRFGYTWPGRIGQQRLRSVENAPRPLPRRLSTACHPNRLPQLASHRADLTTGLLTDERGRPGRWGRRAPRTPDGGPHTPPAVARSRGNVHPPSRSHNRRRWVGDTRRWARPRLI